METIDPGALPIDPTTSEHGLNFGRLEVDGLVFHLARALPRPLASCHVAAARDAIAFVRHSYGLADSERRVLRDVYVLDERTAWADLDRLDPGRRFGVREGGAGADAVARVGIMIWRHWRRGFLDVGFGYAHEYTHLVQMFARGRAAKEADVVVEGEANLVATRWQDARLPGAGTLFWDFDARRIREAHDKHPDLDARAAFVQAPHALHEEITLFSHVARGLAPIDLGRIRAAQSLGASFERAFEEVAGRPLVDVGLERVWRAPDTALRPCLSVESPRLTAVRHERGVWFVAAGFAPGERVRRTARQNGSNGEIATPLVADGRGALAWTTHSGVGGSVIEVEYQLLAASGRARASAQIALDAIPR